MISFAKLFSEFFSIKSKNAKNDNLTTVAKKGVVDNEEKVSDFDIVDITEEEKNTIA